MPSVAEMPREKTLVSPAARAPKTLSNVVRNIFTFPVAIGAILVAKAFFTCRDNIADTDLWWHLRNGQSIFAHRQLPGADTFSFTSAGSPWIDHSWLSELTYFAAFQWF